MKKRIINTGTHLPKATMSDWFELQGNRKKLVTRPIMNQSRKNGTVIYGGHALNALLGKHNQRTTYDYDIYSKHPLKHAQEIEKSIDRGTNSDLAYIERTTYGNSNKPLWRVKIHGNETIEADYNTMPKGLTYVKKNGVRYESITRAEKKYNLMHQNVGHRTAYGELYRIKINKRRKR